MIPLHSLLSLPPKPSLFLSHIPFRNYNSKPHRYFPIHSLPNNPYQQQPNLSSNEISPPQQPRTVFPGGYKRAEIKIPCILLHVDSDDLLESGDDALDLVDKAVAESVGIVVLDGSDATGKRLYEAARLLKSVVRDRAYLLIGERVDIAAAVNANGVLLSDQGLPAIVARNMMLGSQYESVVLPLVARTVETPTAALDAAKSEGADFLIYDSGEESYFDVEMNSVFRDVKIPIFVSVGSVEDRLRFLESGCSGLAASLKDLRLIGSDGLSLLLDAASVNEGKFGDHVQGLDKIGQSEVANESHTRERTAGFVKLADREKQLVKKEKSVLREAISVIQKAAPLMEEVSLLVDAVSRIDEPFMLAIVGEFNSGKSTFINALLGERYLQEGVVPTTNEITFLRYSNYDKREHQRCERNPDGQYICYLPAPVLKEMVIVDTPGTNVILKRQQRLTEEFVPRADLLLFVISADRPLTESEVSFLRYTQQWKKRVVFVLNKADIYKDSSELEEVISFIKENTRKLLNSDDVILYPVSSRSALEQKLSASSGIGENGAISLVPESDWRISSFIELEGFLYSFLDGSTRTGLERMKLKLGTPVGIAERLLSSSETLVKQECRLATQDLAYMTEVVDSVEEYARKMKDDSISWRRRTLSLIDATKSRVLELVKSTLLLSNIDIVASFVFKGESSAVMPVTMKIQNEIITPALLDTQNLLGDYLLWLQSSNSRKGKLCEESFGKRWSSFTDTSTQINLETYELFKKSDELSLRVIEDFSASAISKSFEREIREVFLGTFGGLGAAGLSASLLTSVLPTTMEDLLALGLCSAGGYIAVLNFPARRQKMLDKVSKVADAFALEVEEAMQKDLVEGIQNLENFVKAVAKPYEDAAQEKLDRLLDIQKEVSDMEKEITTLQVEIQNLHL